MPEEFTEPPDWKRMLPASDPEYASQHVGYLVEPADLDGADALDAVIVGEPYDRGHMLGRPGARQGPAELRRGLSNTKAFNLDNGPIELDIGDLGDVSIPEGESNRAVEEYVRARAREIHAADAVPIFLGGDHSLAYPNIAPLLAVHDSVGVVNFDSHDDMREPVDGQPHTASPFYQLHEDGLDAYTVVGARQFGLGGVEYLDDGWEVAIDAETVGDDPDGALDRALDAMDGVDAIYVSIDIDVIDMGIVGGTSSPYPGGILPRELFRMVRRLAGEERVVGLEVVEVAPLLELGHPTESKGVKPAPAAGGTAIAHFLSGLGDRG